MSVVGENEHGWILDHSAFWPFQMDSQFLKYASKVTSAKNTDQALSSHQSTAEKRRKRKRKNPEEGICPDVIKLGHQLMKAHESLTRLGFAVGHFTETSDLPLNNNTAAREAARADDWEMGEDVINDHGGNGTQGGTIERIEDGKAYTLDALSHTLYGWRGDSPAVISGLRGESPDLMADHGESPNRMRGDHYLIPPNSTFYMSQADSLHAFISALDGRKFDLIVLDPPWENKSVKRKKTYAMLAEWELRRLPIPALSRPGCLVAMWVTNKLRQVESVRASVFPEWSVTYLAQWHWIKVTLGGEPVTDIMSQGKKPYESLILGRYLPQGGTAEAGPQYNRPRDPPDNRVILSVPCILHSKKPPLYELLKRYCHSDPQCLELFARNLQPGWTSWGNEVLRHQNLKFYTSRGAMCNDEDSAIIA